MRGVLGDILRHGAETNAPARTDTAMAQIIVRLKDREMQPLPVVRVATRIGRDATNHVVIDNDPSHVRDWRLDQILTSDLFGLPSARAKRLDALIPEPYSQGRPLGGLWRGSDNQPLLPLSPLGEEHYREAVAAPAAGQDKRMQVAIEAGRLWFIGIPHRGDMAALEGLCRARGLDIRSASWR